jgi:excinuclease Cho
MQLNRRHRPEFDATRVFEYPAHLRAAVEVIPTAPGVYVFHGEDGDLPLYIGKSVNLRHRVMSHLRNADEALMLRQTKRISHIRTAGEIGALLLEASMIKQQHPLLNQKLRRSRELCSLQMQEGKLTVVYSKDLDFATGPDLYGLFASRHSALQALRDLADQQKLCFGVLGLEKLAEEKPCFRAMVRQCAGACRGDESREMHDARLKDALEGLRVCCWPFSGAVGLVERHGEDYQMHVIRNWNYLGSVTDPKSAILDAKKLARMAAGFDADGYKILCKPILSGTAEIVLL